VSADRTKPVVVEFVRVEADADAGGTLRDPIVFGQPVPTIAAVGLLEGLVAQCPHARATAPAAPAHKGVQARLAICADCGAFCVEPGQWKRPALHARIGDVMQIARDDHEARAEAFAVRRSAAAPFVRVELPSTAAPGDARWTHTTPEGWIIRVRSEREPGDRVRAFLRGGMMRAVRRGGLVEQVDVEAPALDAPLDALEVSVSRITYFEPFEGRNSYGPCLGFGCIIDNRAAWDTYRRIADLAWAVWHERFGSS
jgi:hypothetical protein